MLPAWQAGRLTDGDTEIERERERERERAREREREQEKKQEKKQERAGAGETETIVQTTLLSDGFWGELSLLPTCEL